MMPKRRREDKWRGNPSRKSRFLDVEPFERRYDTFAYGTSPVSELHCHTKASFNFLNSEIAYTDGLIYRNIDINSKAQNAGKMQSTWPATRILRQFLEIGVKITERQRKRSILGIELHPLDVRIVQPA
jgi:hypothetical protein